MRDREPTVRRRELGDALRQAMERAGLTGADMARRLGCSQTWVSRLLSGKRGSTENDVTAFATICGVNGKELARLQGLAREQTQVGWLQQHGSRLPKQVRTLIDHEDHSREISQFGFTLVPGLLQTGDYARTVISENVNVPADEVDDRVSARLARQALFSRYRRPTFAFFLHEFALRLPVGDAQTMADQLEHLLRMSARTYLTIRVVPTAIGAHAGMSGPFTLLDVIDFKQVVYLDSETSNVFLEEPVEIAAYRNILAALDRTALDEEQSRTMVATVARTQYADREVPQ
ncbi:helix-turn-helix protein [Herbihabitans rhizosphaerae]|uniref:Helix-turn-helix protein n=1 Tax=Herbihabitans rhizosphaerae TaxID=1872711 RepID=A0A4Q7KXC4_9PSEU|nr:helix-turn-helix transcriptional regulator [Herbihabitans rhizosphaerae]RZS40960.1 helix-turn-helix protein [Herbihabitans rhizosphaerae]